MQDKENNMTTRNFVVDKVGPELLELINKYKPEVLWSDGDWEVSDVMIVTSRHKRNYSPSLDSRPPPSTGTLSSSWPGSTRSPRSRRPWSPTTGEC